LNIFDIMAKLKGIYKVHLVREVVFDETTSGKLTLTDSNNKNKFKRFLPKYFNLDNYSIHISNENTTRALTQLIINRRILIKLKIQLIILTRSIINKIILIKLNIQQVILT